MDGEEKEKKEHVLEVQNVVVNPSAMFKVKQNKEEENKEK